MKNVEKAPPVQNSPEITFPPLPMLQSKSALRRHLKIRVARLPPARRRLESDTLCQRLIDDPRLRAATSIGAYLALPDEPDLRPALEVFRERNQRLALPFPEPGGDWSFREIFSLDGPASGPWGLTLPKPGPRIDASGLDAVLVPGRGFTREGHRLGRGKGIYDRLLAGGPALAIGIGFQCQVVDQLPHDPHDIQLQDVWTAETP